MDHQHYLPPSIEKTYTDRLERKQLDPDSDEALAIRARLCAAYERKKAASRVSAQAKRDRIRNAQWRTATATSPTETPPPGSPKPDDSGSLKSLEASEASCELTSRQLARLEICLPAGGQSAAPSSPGPSRSSA